VRRVEAWKEVAKAKNNLPSKRRPPNVGVAIDFGEVIDYGLAFWKVDPSHNKLAGDVIETSRIPGRSRCHPCCQKVSGRIGALDENCRLTFFRKDNAVLNRNIMEFEGFKEVVIRGLHCFILHRKMNLIL